MNLLWRAGLLLQADLQASHTGTCILLHASENWRVTDGAGQAVACRRDGHHLRFRLRAGQRCRITTTP